MSGAAPRVFIARLAGASVFDPNGDQVGRLRDVVVALRGPGLPPRVLGLVVEVPMRRRIFVPILRVTSIDPGQIVTTGVVNMRRFEQRGNERLVIGEIVDRKAHLAGDPSGSPVTVIDTAMEQDKARDWLLVKVFVRRGGSGFRRRGETLTVAWDGLVGLSDDEQDQAADSLVASFEKLRPADIASALQDLPSKRRAEVAAALDNEKLADVLEELPEDEQVEILAALQEERAADVLEAMGPDDAADLLRELPPEQAQELLDLMEPEEAEDVRRLIGYDDYSAGGLMTTEPVVLSPDATVADALARIRNSDLSPALASQVYVVRPPLETPTGRFLGVAHFQRLLREPPSTLVSAVVDTDLEAVGPEAPLGAVTRYFATYNLVALPVVDPGGHLLGAVTVDDVIDHMLPEDWRETELADEAAEAARQAADDGA